MQEDSPSARRTAAICRHQTTLWWLCHVMVRPDNMGAKVLAGSKAINDKRQTCSAAASPSSDSASWPQRCNNGSRQQPRTGSEVMHASIACWASSRTCAYIVSLSVPSYHHDFLGTVVLILKPAPPAVRNFVKVTLRGHPESKIPGSCSIGLDLSRAFRIWSQNYHKYWEIGSLWPKTIIYCGC